MLFLHANHFPVELTAELRQNKPMARFTVENAAEMGRRSAELRKQREAMPQPTEPPAAIVPLSSVEPTKDEYLTKRLNRVRVQIERLSDMLDEETDPNKLDRIASALDRLDEMERKLAGRPLPGTLKPTSKPTRQPLQVAPLPGWTPSDCGSNTTTGCSPAGNSTDSHTQEPK